MKIGIKHPTTATTRLATFCCALAIAAVSFLGGTTHARIVVSSSGIDASTSDHALVATVGQQAIGLLSSGTTNCALGFWTGSPTAGTCCLGTKGNVDDSPEDTPDISDLVYLVQYMVAGGPAPVCIAEADLMPDGVIDISDIVMMIVIMYIDNLDFPPCGEPQNKTAMATREKFIVEQIVDSGRTSIVVRTDRDLLGIQLSLSSGGSDVIGESIAGGIETFVGPKDDSTIVLIFDMEGIQSIVSGRQAVLVVDRECEVLSAKAINDELQRMTAEIRRRSVSTTVPGRYALFQNYPNPFNPTTTISFDLPQASDVRLEVVNILGQVVAVPTEGHYPAGHHNVVWDSRDASGRQVASGVYFYRLQAGDFSETRKMLLLK